MQLINIKVVKINYVFCGIIDIKLDEKELNSLNKCDKFFGGFNANHDSFESLLQ